MHKVLGTDGKSPVSDGWMQCWLTCMHPDAEQVGTLHRPLQKRSVGQRKQPVLMLMLPKHKGLMGGSLHHSFPSMMIGRMHDGAIVVNYGVSRQEERAVGFSEWGSI